MIPFFRAHLESAKLKSNGVYCNSDGGIVCMHAIIQANEMVYIPTIRMSCFVSVQDGDTMCSSAPQIHGWLELDKMTRPEIHRAKLASCRDFGPI